MNATIYWLASYPKSGNTWLRIFLDNLKSFKGQPVSFNELGSSIASNRVWLDEVLGASTADLTARETLLIRPHIYQWSSQSATEQCYVKVHDANVEVSPNQYLFPLTATAGVVYIIRNPLDVVVSLAHHNNSTVKEAISDLNDPKYKFSRFNGKRLTLQVEQLLFSWSQHVESWVDHKGFDMLVVRYEDMKRMPHDTFSKIADHLGISYDVSRLDRAIENSSFDVLRAQEKIHTFKERSPKSELFFRKGMIGDWRNILNDSDIKKIITNHREVMRRFGYIDESDIPTIL